LEKAIELNPTDSSLFYLIGVWYFGFSNRSNFDRIVESFYSNSQFPKVSFEEALKFFLEAEKIHPNFLKQNTIMIGKTYEKMGDKVKAKEWLQQSLQMPNKNLQDEIYHEEAANLFNKLQI
jgi:tetratricopeptide (TPR) repeat protein